MNTYASNHGPVVAAHDAGHGHNKALLSPAMGEKKSWRYASYVGQANDSQDDALRNHDVVRVQVDGVPFWTGTDAGFVLGPRATRNRDESYMHTPAYKALFLGTLWHFAQRSIDTLAVGLPNTTFRRYKDELKAALEGQHQVPDFSRGMRDYRQGEISVTVRDVIVCPQSYAAYVYASSMQPSLGRGRVLVVEPGWNTLDTLIVEDGKPVPGTARPIEGSMGRVVQALQESMLSSIKLVSGAYNPRLITERDAEAALVAHYKQQESDAMVRTAMGEQHVADHLGAIDAAVNTALEPMFAELSDHLPAITAVCVCGGGAPVFVEVLRKRLPLIRNIYVSGTPQFDVASGLLLVAQRANQASLQAA